jgi:hypothetical protein
MSQRLRDLLTRVGRTFLQGAVPVFLVTAVGPLRDVYYDLLNVAAGHGTVPEAHVDALRSVLVAVVAGGLVALGSLVHNWINDYLKLGNAIPVIGKPVDRAIGDQALGETKT